MNTAVVLTHGYFISADAREQTIMKPYPPLGILYIASFLEKAGIDVQVFDSTFSTQQLQQEYISQHSPVVLGLYANLMTKKQVLSLIKWVKSCPELSHTVVVVGGPDARYNRMNWLLSGADYVLSGEGEQAFLELTQQVLSGRKPFHVPSLSFLKENVLTDNPPAAQLSMDVLTVPARHKIRLHDYLDAWKSRHGYAAISVSTMRGCPYNCKWCSRAVYGQSYRRRSPALVADELQELVRTYQSNTFWFVDDVFTVSHKWLEAFATELSSRNLNIRYECITRADRMNDRVIELLKTSGCFRVWIGAESGSQEVIDKMDRRVDVQVVRDMIVRSRKAGIEAGTFIMLGYPGETEKDILETLHHLKSSMPDYFTLTTAYPIRGTELYNEHAVDTEKNEQWDTITDREIPLKRNYSDKYYRNAIRYINNSMNVQRLRVSGQSIPLSMRAKVILSRSFMFLYK